MKHLLIILISFLLLSSPVIGDNQKGETLYRLDTSSGYVWKEFGEKDFLPKYQGQVKDGKPNGQGTFTWSDGSKYVGDWKDGEMNGQGTFTNSWGDKYVGEYKDGKPNGQGTGNWFSGSVYVGEWKNGRRNGQGTTTRSDLVKWVGEYKVGYLWNGTQYDKDGKIEYKYVNGKRIKQ
tara:strand:- start:37 stop:567 length:531 start_codon:yes stop_codon:yes gene_type:complete